MFLASPILGNIICNYTSTYDLPYGLVNIDWNNVPARQSGMIKNVNNPKTAYHTWIKDGAEFDRAGIIERMLEGSTTHSFHTLQASHASNISHASNTSKLSHIFDLEEKKLSQLPIKKVTSSHLSNFDNDHKDSESDDSDGDNDNDNDHKDRDSESDDSDGDNHNDINITNTNAITNEMSVNYPSNITEEITINQLFKQLTALRWCDRDERKLTANSLNVLNIQTLRTIVPTMDKLAIELTRSISNETRVLDNMNAEEKNNFLYHIIAKGREFYFSVVTDPEFCLYLLDDQYQPLYSFITEKLRRNR